MAHAVATKRVTRTWGITAFQLFKKFPQTHVFHRLPQHYKNQLINWYDNKPLPVHFIPDERKYYKDPETGEKKIVQNMPIPLIFPKEVDDGLWGGEGIIKGYKVGRGKGLLFQFPSFRRPHYWAPTLRINVVYSEILDKYLSVTVTDRTLNLIDAAYGFDNYILQTELIDLRSQLGCKLRRMMLKALSKKDFYHSDSVKREEVYEKYQKHLVPEEEIEWVGLTIGEAIKKQLEIENAEKEKLKPLKYKLRKEFVEKLKAMEAEDEKIEEKEMKNRGWLSSLFTKSEKKPEKTN